MFLHSLRQIDQGQRSAQNPDHPVVHVRAVYRRIFLDSSDGQKRRCDHLFKGHLQHPGNQHLRFCGHPGGADPAALPAGIPVRVRRLKKHRPVLNGSQP